MRTIDGEKKDIVRIMAEGERTVPDSIILKMSADSKKDFYKATAALFQGFMMEVICPEYAERLHHDGIHPYSTSFMMADGFAYWRVNTLSDEAQQQLIQPLLNRDVNQIYLKGKDAKFSVLEKTLIHTSYEDMIQKYYFGGGDRFIHLHFLTPASFKKSGRYMIYPTPRLIFQSLMQKYDACSEQSSIFSEELLEEFENYTVVKGYRMRSTQYKIEQVRIPSFMGDITLEIGGSKQLANVAKMLVKFGEFSGVGIKTGMGMGAIKVLENSRSVNEEEKLRK